MCVLKAIQPKTSDLNTKISFLAFVFFSLSLSVFAQKATLQGIITDSNNIPVEGVAVKSEIAATTSSKDGRYTIEAPADEPTAIYFTHTAFSPKALKISLKNGEVLTFNTSFTSAKQLDEVTIVNQRDREEGIVKLQPATIRNLASANAGVEGLLKLLGGVNSNNELSTAYSVRGGNYDENLVYVNEIEVYRPFLIRSGQQEGLSFTNTDMVEKVDFSAGGFQAKYGDKLSSVLDITYRRPDRFGVAAQASFLGGSVALEAASKDRKWSSITGVRYRDNSLLVNSQQTESNFHPTFADVQTYLTYMPNDRWKISFLGNISQNKYNYEPLSRQTNFGTIDEPIALQIFYEGQEKDKYTTYFGALKTEYNVSDSFTLKLIGSAYHTQEQEYFDILAQYRLGEVNTNIGSDNYGDVEYTEGIGSQFNHARNDLDALIINAEVKGVHKLKNKHEVEWGVKYTREDFRDRLVEWEVIDSAGFSINPPKVLTHNTQPYTPYSGPLVPYQNVRATNYVTIDRLSAYAQWSHRTMWGSNDVYMNIGARVHNWAVSGEGISKSNQTVVSPRAQFTIKPSWEKDMLFRLSGGYYYQPPFYRELRDADGVVNPDVKAQRSIHVVVANDFSFKMWDNRPFKLVTELYYKDMTDVNTYTLDNVRIRYVADNNAKAFAQGVDVRLNGEFVKGTESWLSFGYMKTEENYNNKGYIARPTDQRLKFGILFQDYMPNIPGVKLYLNLVYNTGLPGGSPSYADPYQYQTRLRDYRRADVGFSYVLTENNKNRPEGHWLKKFKDLSVGFEIFNLFDNQNAITNTWVRDVYSKVQYGVPNYLTTRVFNVKLSMRL